MLQKIFKFVTTEGVMIEISLLMVEWYLYQKIFSKSEIDVVKICYRKLVLKH